MKLRNGFFRVIKPSQIVNRVASMVLIAATLAAFPVAAAVLSINFIQDPGSANQQIDAGETFGIDTLGTVVGGWVNVNGPADVLPDSDGNATPVRLLAVSQPNGQATFNSAYANTPLLAGFDDYTGTVNPTSVTFTNLAAFFPYGYKVIAYVGGFNACSNASISDGSTTFYFQTLKSPAAPVSFVRTTTDSNPGSLDAPVAQYAVFGEPTLLTADAITLTLDTLHGGGAGLCGVQLLGLSSSEPPPRLLACEGFDASGYAAGVSLLNNSTLGFGYDGPWTGYGGQVKILADSLVYPGYGADGEHRVQLTNNSAIRRQFLPGNNGPLGNYMDTNGVLSISRDGTPLYLAFLVRARTNAAPGGSLNLFNGDYSLGNRLFMVQLSPTLPCPITATPPSGAIAQTLGNNNDAVNLVVARFDFADRTIRAWLNPAADEAEPAPAATFTNVTIAFDRLQLTHGYNNDAVEFDEIRFGNYWAATIQAAALSALPGEQPLAGMRGLPPSPIGGSNYPREFFPFVDAFGQYRHLEWSNKVHSLAELQQHAADEAADLAANPGPNQWCEYGGWINGPQLAGTGMFRVQKYQGDWWFVDPHGHLFWSHGATGVHSPNAPTGVTDRQNYFADLPEPGDPESVFFITSSSSIESGFYAGTRPLTMDFMAVNALRKYGPGWVQFTRDLNHARLRSWGMNSIGSWTTSDTYLLRRTPYGRVFYPYVAGINGDARMPDYFNPAFATSLTNALSGPERNDPWCLGFYINNELDWTRPGHFPDIREVGLTALAAASSSFAKAAFRDQLAATYGSIASLNAQWGTSYSSWNDVLNQRSTFPSGAGGDPDLNAFYRAYAEQFFRTCAEVIHGHTSNLFLGSRFAGQPHVDAARACTNHVDVASANSYSDTATIPAGLEADIPFLNTEHNFVAKDTGLFWQGLNLVASQAERASHYTTHFNAAANNARIVGTHWFQFLDRSTTGILNSDADGNNNNGLVDVTDTPYSPLIGAARTAGQNMYTLRLGTTPPTLSPITNRSIAANTSTGPIPFTVGDDATPPDSLALGKECSNTNLFPLNNIVFGGNGSNRTVTVTPQLNQSGVATLTLIVTDAKGARGFASFELTVLPVPPAPPVFAHYSLSNQTFSVTVSGEPGWTYYIQASTNLADWQTVFTNLNAQPPLTWTEVQTTELPARFYRVLMEPPQ